MERRTSQVRPGQVRPGQGQPRVVLPRPADGPPAQSGARQPDPDQGLVWVPVLGRPQSVGEGEFRGLRQVAAPDPVQPGQRRGAVLGRRCGDRLAEEVQYLRARQRHRERVEAQAGG